MHSPDAATVDADAAPPAAFEDAPRDRPLVDALVAVGQWLQSSGYAFTTVTPGTHERVLARARAGAVSPEDIFGWNRDFHERDLPASVLAALRDGGLLEQRGGGMLKSGVRYATLNGRLYAHGAYPTVQDDAVFFGPDTYRFASFIAQSLELIGLPVGAHVLDLGCGGGAGGLEALLQRPAPGAALWLSDINPRALDFARANARLAGVAHVRFVHSDLYQALPDRFDLVVANPPYMLDPAARAYRNGGGRLGERLSERIVAGTLPRLAPGGRLLLYTGVAMTGGHDPFLTRLGDLIGTQAAFTYREIDPDVFGEELSLPHYAAVDRIAVVGLVARKPAGDPRAALG